MKKYEIKFTDGSIMAFVGSIYFVHDRYEDTVGSFSRKNNAIILNSSEVVYVREITESEKRKLIPPSQD